MKLAAPFSRAVSAALALALGACLSDQTPPLRCGDGQAFAYAGADYCMFAAPIIIEGFDCPPSAPFMFQSPDEGVVVCSPSETPPTGGWDGLAHAWKTSEHPGADAGDATSPDADATPAPKTACDLALDLQVGAAVPQAGDGCTVAKRCDEGLVAQCAAGPYAVDCAFGDARAVPIASAACPSRHARLGEDCVAGLGADACADGFYCAPGTGQCAALPALCDGSACLGDGDCSGACAGGSSLAGTLGLCLAAPAAAECWEAADCPSGWSCDGAVRGCAPCTSCSTPSTAGVCRPPLATALGVIAAPGAAAAVWYVGEGYALVGCPAFALEQRDEVTGLWSSIGGDSACSGPVSPPFGAALTFAPVAVTPAVGFDYAWVRARGSYWGGCTGSGTDSCSSGPTELVSEPVLVRP